MRAVVQRVKRGRVSVNGETIGEIGLGLVILVGVGQEDDQADVDYLADKTCYLRIFEDQQGKMNLSVRDVGGEVLVISQFTLYADCRKGRRPSFSEAAPPAKARRLYEDYVEVLRQYGLHVKTGQFQENMLVEIENDGPVTVLLDSKRQF